MTTGTFVEVRSTVVGSGVAGGREGPATITGGATCPTPIRGIAGPAPAPAAATTPPPGSADSVTELPVAPGTVGPAELRDTIDADDPAGTTNAALGATGPSPAESSDAGGTGRRRALGFGVADAGLAAVLLGFSPAESTSPQALVSEARVKIMSLTRSLAIGGKSTAAL